MKALVLLADGFEEAEAFCPYDVLKRAGLDVRTAGLGEKVTSSHGIAVIPDFVLTDVFDEEVDIVFCPGGMPGAVNLAQAWPVNKLLVNTYNNGGIVAALCASPAVVLGPIGLLNGKLCTTYPGTESYSPDIVFSDEGVVADGKIITGKSAGWAFDIGLKLVEVTLGKEKAEEIKNQIYYKC